MEVGTDQRVHIKCGFCGKDFEVTRDEISSMQPGEPVSHRFDYCGLMMGVQVFVHPHQIDMCRKCASRSAQYVGHQLYNSTHKPSELLGQSGQRQADHQSNQQHMS